MPPSAGTAANSNLSISRLEETKRDQCMDTVDRCVQVHTLL